jgi:hypothetical protein
LASKSPKALAAYLRRSASRGGKARVKVLTAEERHLHPGWRQSEIERAMDKVSKTPGAITYMPTFICALCQRTVPCLGAPPSVKEARGEFRQTLHSP